MTQMDKPQRVWINDTEVELSAHDHMPKDEAADDRRRQLVTIDGLMRDTDNGRRIWYARLDGGVETRLRDDLTVIVRWTPDPGYPDRAYAVLHSSHTNVRANLDTMHDLDELVRIFSLLSTRPPLE